MSVRPSIGTPASSTDTSASDDGRADPRLELRHHLGASGQVFRCGPLSVEYTTIVSSAIPELVEQVQQIAHDVVVVEHRVVVLGLPATGATLVIRVDVGPEAHV